MLNVAPGSQSGSGAERFYRGAQPGANPREAAGLLLSNAAWSLWRHRWVMLLCVLLVPAIAWAGLKQLTPLFTATASVIYEPATYQQQELQSILRADTTSDEVIASQVEVIQGLHSAQRVAEKFDLMENPEFNPTLRPKSTASAIIEGVSGGVRGGIAFLIRPVFPAAADSLVQDNRPPATEDETRRLVVTMVQQAITAEAVRQSHVIDVSFTSRSRMLASQVANDLANMYISDQLQMKFDAVRNANKWLEGQVHELQQQVQADENKIANYRSSQGLTQGVQAGLATEEVSRLSDSLVAARNDLAQAEGTVSAAHGRLGTSAQAAVSPSVIALRAQRDALSAQLQSLLAHLGPNHPTVLAMRQQLGVLSSEVNAETGQVMAASDAAVRSARAKVAGLEQELRDAREQVATAGQAEIPLEAMQRESDASRNLLSTVLGSMQRLAQQAAIEQADARIVSLALPPGEPSYPKTKILLPAAVLLGFCIGFLLVYLLELTQSKFRSGHDIRSVLGLNCLAQIPQIDRDKEGVSGMEEYLVQKPFSLGAEQVRSLRAALWLGTSRPKVVAIAAARPGEGKTTTSICLARSASLAGERIVVVECDTRKPSFAKLMGVKEKTGLLEFLSGTATLEDVIHTDKLTNFDYIAAGVAGRSNSHSLFMSENMVMLLERLRRDYDLVVLDLPPVIAMTDARIVASLAESTLLCVRWQTTPRAVAKHCYEMLQDAGANVVGAALTRVNMRAHARSGHTDAEAYHSRYAPYYQH